MRGITAGLLSMVVSVAVVMKQRLVPHEVRIWLRVTVGAESRLQVPAGAEAWLRVSVGAGTRLRATAGAESRDAGARFG